MLPLDCIDHALFQVTNNYRQTPLHIAARLHMLPAVILLLEHGGNAPYLHTILLFQHRFHVENNASHAGNPLLRQNDGRNTLDMLGARTIAAHPALQAAVDDAVLRLDTRWGGADAADAAAATSASHSHMKRQYVPRSLPQYQIANQ